VLVTTVVRDAAWAGDRSHPADDALLVTLKTRRAQ
jgi:hypothetical protein